MNEPESPDPDQHSGMNGVVLSPALLSALYAEVLVPLGVPPALPALKNVRERLEPASEANVSAVPAGIARPADAAAPAVQTSTAKPASVVFLGENLRNICLVVSIPGNAVLPVSTKVFLEKMLAACRLGTVDLAIVNISLSPATAADLSARFSPEKWLLAGISPAALGIDLPGSVFEVQSWNGSQVLCLPPLAGMEQDSPVSTQLKRQLWAGLKKLFGI